MRLSRFGMPRLMMKCDQPGSSEPGGELLQQLRMLVAVIGEGSLGRAAARLKTTQPALSRQVRRLETKVGVPLLERHGQGVRPTAAGRVLAAESVDLDALLRSALVASIESHLGMRGTVNVGVARGVLDGRRLSRALARVRRELPHVRVHLAEIPSIEQAQALRAGRIDVAAGLADPEGDGIVRREPLYEESVDSVLVARDHPLASRPRLSVADLRDVPLVKLTHFNHAGLRLIEVEEGVATRVHDQATMAGVYAMVAAGAGWTFGIRAMREHPPPGTVLRRVHGFRGRIAVSLRLRARDLSLAQQNVVRIIREECGDEQRAPDASTASAPLADAAAVAGWADRALKLLHLEELVAFAAAADEGSVSGAAHQLRITQSGVSRRLLALERVLAFPLLVRSGHGVRATDAGLELRNRLSAVIECADGIVPRARLAARGVTGICRLGTLPEEIIGGMQAALLRELCERHPDIGMEIFEMLPERQLEALAERRIDIAIGGTLGPHPPPGVNQVVLADEVIDSAVVARDNVLAQKSWLVADDLRDEPFYFVERSEAPQVYDTVVQGLSGLGLRPDPMLTHSGPRAVWAAVASGRGWTIASRPERGNPPAGLVAIPVVGLRIPVAITLMWREGETNSVVQRVTEVIRTMRLTDAMPGIAAASRDAGAAGAS